MDKGHFFVGTEIAVVGLAGRFPGARDIDEYWQNLCDGVESIRPVDDRELEDMGVDPALLHDPGYVKASAALEGMELFDAAFFGFTPREAELMDPQHRIFLECCWQALEHAGYDAATCSGSIGVFGGATTNTYLLYNLVSNRELLSALDLVQIDVGNGADFLTTRVSYKLGLKGPSCTVQSACSTSLVAVHVACQSLLNLECDMALAGGVSIHVKHPEGYRYLEGGIVSPDGHCRAFDAGANGTVFGSGAGIVVLKRLEDALADGDPIHAVIKGSAFNNDGALKVGYTAPGVEGQAKVITEALAVAGIEASTIGYLETHGTGTRLGDPIEIRASTKAFRTHTKARGYCPIGSVKSNIGHLAGAAGIASLIKAVLVVKHGLIPPSLHFEQPNPEIDFADSPFYVNTRLTEWQAADVPRRAGVSSFGMGGTNAHAILEEAPVAEPSGPSHPVQLLLLSAKTETALDAATANLAAYLKQQPDLCLADAAYTLAVGRQPFDQRRAAVCRTDEEAIEILEGDDPQRLFSAAAEGHDRPVVFLFPGQGAQYVDMGRGLYETEPVFRQQMDACAELLRPHLGLDLHTLLYPDGSQVEGVADRLAQTAIAQPALFAIEYALACLWQSWGVQPQALIGHSIGEYVAACLAGVFSLQDALALVAARGRLMQDLPAGAMLAVPLPEAEVRPLLAAALSIAAINGPDLTVVSGSFAAVEALEAQLDEQRIAYRRLHTSHAFHSAMMDPILERFAGEVARVERHPPQIPYLSNVTGTWIEDAQATDPTYWAQHLRQGVRFSDGLELLLQDPARILLEVGPGNTLTRLAKRHSPAGRSAVVLPSLRHPQEQQPDAEYLLATLGQLWLAGATVDWLGFYADEQRRRLPLPTYPFERQRYWIEPRAEAWTPQAPTLQKKADLADWFYTPVWKSAPPPQPVQTSDLAAIAGTWLLFVDEHGLGEALAARLRVLGQSVVTVTADERFTPAGEGSYRLDPRRRADYDALLDALGELPGHVVHLWSLAPHPEVTSGPAFFERCQDAGFYSLLFLAQALAARGAPETLPLQVVSDHVLRVVESETAYPEKATLLGICRVASQEIPHLSCHFVDIVVPEPGTAQATRQVEQLLAEVVSESEDTSLAYRGSQRWVPTFEPLPLRSGDNPLRPLREGGAYLVVGNSPDFDAVLAEFLAVTLQARLALVHDAGSGDYEAIAHTVRERGGEALILATDLADGAQMQAAVAQTEAHLGSLHGVFYSASVPDDRILQGIAEIDHARCAPHFQPKVHGLFALARALDGQALDFCLLSGSLSSVLGGVGFAAYTAANLFLDAFVQQQNVTSHFPWIAVDWDFWLLGGEAAQRLALSADLSRFALLPDEGTEALHRIVTASTVDRIVVSTGDLAARIEQTRPRSQEPGELADSQPAARHERPALRTKYVPPRNDLERQVAEIWHQVLGISEIGINDDFFDLGGHSLLATQLRNHLYEAFKVELPIQGLFEHPTVAGVAQLIAAGADRAESRKAQPLAEQLRIAFPTERQGVLEDYLRPRVAHGLGIEASHIPPDGDLSGFDLALVAVDLMWNLKQDLKLQLYPHEVTARPSLPALAGFVLAEWERMDRLPQLATTKPLSAYTLKPYGQDRSQRPLSIPDKKNRSMVFLHSSPRAGSTLLRVMLASHPDLFCPPELNLLFFEDMQDWRQNIGFGHDFQWTAQGLHWAFVELLGLSTEEGWALLEEMVEQNHPVPRVYARLQELAGERLLVDKTPPYAMDLQTLHRAEALFDAPKYILLVRHPYSVIDSLLRARFDRLFSTSLFEEADIDPYVVAETVWALPNRNLLNLAAQVGPERCHLVRYEDLVRQPEEVMLALCRFLEIPFDPSLLQPYDGRRERMMGGLGDPNIFEHSAIDPTLGTAWKGVNLPRRLDESTRQVAAQLGYELAEEETSPPTAPSWAEQQPAVDLDALTAEQVYTLLSEMLAEGEKDE